MKKTLVAIIAIMLIISVCFVFVGCPKTPTPNDDKPCTSHVDANNDGKCDVCGTKMQTTQPGKEPTQGDLDVAGKVASYLSAWLLNNADTHTLNKVRTEVVGNFVAKYAEISKMTVEEVKEGGKTVAYKLTYNFADGAKYEQRVDVQVGNNGHHAGQEYAGTTAGAKADDALVAIINAAFRTCKTAVENGASFSENGFGFDATAYFDFYYGEMAQMLTYGLRLAGQIGINAEDTYVAIEVVEGTTVIGGLYYEGAENKADCKLYLHAGDYKYYIDNSDLNAIVIAIMDFFQGAVGGGKVEEVAGALADPFYETEIKSLADLGLPEMVGSIISGILNEVNATTIGDTTRYQIKINLSELLDAIKGSFGDVLNGVTEMLPAPLNQLDLGSFTGIGGVLMICADVNDAGLGGLELSYNAPKQDFRFSYDDDVAKVYGPINVAIGIKDFELATQSKSEVLPGDLGSYDYFSPLNAELEVDVAINDVEYNATIVADINPFAFENGVITFVVDKDGSAWMNGRLEIVSPDEDELGWNGLVVVSVDGQIYKFYTGELMGAVASVAMSTFEAVIEGENVFTPIINYILDLIAQFAPDTDAPQLASAEDGGFDIGAITGAFDIIDAAKELFAKWEAEGVLTYKFDGETLLDNYFQVKLSADEYNAVIALVNEYLGGLLGIDLPDFSADAAKIFVSANYGEHVKQVYVSVEYMDVAVVVLLDGTKWESEKVVDLTVDINGDKYVLALDAHVDGVYNLTYTAKDVKYVDITVDTNEMSISATLLANGNTHEFNANFDYIMDGDEIIGGKLTLDLDGVQTEWWGKLGYFGTTGSTSFNVPTIGFGAQFGWSIPNNTTSVKVDVKVVSWGSAVTVADNADLMNQEATADISDALQAMADAFLGAIAVEA